MFCVPFLGPIPGVITPPILPPFDGTASNKNKHTLKCFSKQYQPVEKQLTAQLKP